MNNINSIAIICFLILYVLINYLKPSFLYNQDGSIREFGLGKKNKTIIPIWLIVFILAIFSYLFALYFVKMM